MVDGVQTHTHPRPLQLDPQPHASFQPLHLHWHTPASPLTPLIQSQCQPGQLLLLPCRFSTLTHKPQTVFVCNWSVLHRIRMRYVLDWTIWEWAGKQTSGCPAFCPGRTQQEAARSLTADPSQTQHDLQLQLPGWQGLDTIPQAW